MSKFSALLLLSLMSSFKLWANSENLTTVQQFIAAYNQHSIDDMLVLTDDAVKWFWLIDQQLVLETNNKSALRLAMQQHFISKPSAYSEIKQSLMLGNTVTLIEEAFNADHSRSQCALSIYQLADKLIVSVTYYPATACQSD